MTARLIAAAFFLLAGCDARTSARGQVVDADGRPIEGALVVLSSSSDGRTYDARTSPDGSFELGITHGFRYGDFTVSAQKPGFKPARAEISPKEHSRCRIVLIPEAASAASAVSCTH